MDLLQTTITWIEQHPVTGAAILGAVGFIAVTVLRHVYSRMSKSPYIGPVFYSLGKKYIVTAVHEYIPSGDTSGYKQIQHDRPEQWKKLINIKTTLFGLRHEVIPFDSSASMAVVIRPNKKNNEKTIRFNR